MRIQDLCTLKRKGYLEPISCAVGYCFIAYLGTVSMARPITFLVASTNGRSEGKGHGGGILSYLMNGNAELDGDSFETRSSADCL
jgi:hypothetical protein